MLTTKPRNMFHRFHLKMTIVYMRIPVTKRNLLGGTSKSLTKSQKAYSATCFCWTSLSQHAAWLVQDPNTHKSLRNDPVLSYLRLFTQKTYLVNNQSEKIHNPGLLRLQTLKTCTGSHVWHLSWHPKWRDYPISQTCRERRGQNQQQIYNWPTNFPPISEFCAAQSGSEQWK